MEKSSFKKKKKEVSSDDDGLWSNDFIRYYCSILFCLTCFANNVDNHNVTTNDEMDKYS